jgi:hypothetical protein
LRSVDVDVEQKVFRYEAGSVGHVAFVEEKVVDTCAFGCSDSNLVYVRDDSDGYCDWLETLTGD